LPEPELIAQTTVVFLRRCLAGGSGNVPRCGSALSGCIGRKRSESRRVVGMSGDVRGSRLLTHAHLVSAGFQECTCKRGPGKSGSPPMFRPSRPRERGDALRLRATLTHSRSRRSRSFAALTCAINGTALSPLIPLRPSWTSFPG